MEIYTQNLKIDVSRERPTHLSFFEFCGLERHYLVSTLTALSPSEQFSKNIVLIFSSTSRFVIMK